MASPLETTLAALYSPAGASANLPRYQRVEALLTERLPGAEPIFYSCPGRTEISGNHTDHNGGVVITASVMNDIVAAVSPSGDQFVTVVSEGMGEPFRIRTDELSPISGEGGSAALLRGIVAGFAEHGTPIRGVTCALSSTVAPGSGLSSSAALEMLLTTAFDELWSGGRRSLIERALIGQKAEHLYWNKPVGLLDQLGCATGGMIQIDFVDPSSPRVIPLPLDIESESHVFLTVDPGGSHAELSHEYASVPNEMFAVARVLGVSRLIETSEVHVFERLPELRRQLGDRPILRALHFFSENDRVRAQAAALKAGNIPKFVEHLNASGSSSWRLLQNCYPTGATSQQPLALALGIAERLFGGSSQSGARVHGGGFAGMILAVVERARVESFVSEMERVFGSGAVRPIGIRSTGVVNVSAMSEQGRSRLSA